jgi:putative ABC transport system substrate-binding protein
MRRRDFITLVGGTALAWPLGAHAQQPAPPVIGFLNDLSPDQWPAPLSGFRRGLSEAGYAEGRNVSFAYKWTEGRRDRLPELAADLARANVAVIIASGDTAAAMSARAATAEIPIVFAIEDDPVRFGLAASLDRPGGNATGIYLDTPAEVATTRRDLLRQINPKIGASLWMLGIVDASADPSRTDPEAALTGLLDGVRVRTGTTDPNILRLLRSNPEAALKQTYEQLGKPDDNDRVTPAMMRALEIKTGPFLDGRRRQQAIALAARHAIPTLYHWRAFVEAGGLISYGFDIEDVYARMGREAGEILKGGNTAEMPVRKPTKLETVINLRTAAELGLNLSPDLLARVDTVIQ